MLDKNQLNLMRLVHAMRSNGPLPQVVQNRGTQKFTFYFINVNHLYKTVPHVLAMLNLYSASPNHSESPSIDPLNIVGLGDKHPLAYECLLDMPG